MNLMANCIDKYKELLESFKVYFGCNWVREMDMLSHGF